MYEIMYKTQLSEEWISVFAHDAHGAGLWCKRLLVNDLVELRVENKDAAKPYSVQTFVGDYKVLDERFSRQEDATSYANSFADTWTNHVPDGQSHRYTSAAVLHKGIVIYERDFTALDFEREDDE